jgi:hypothetical protein
VVLVLKFANEYAAGDSANFRTITLGGPLIIPVIPCEDVGVGLWPPSREITAKPFLRSEQSP